MRKIFPILFLFISAFYACDNVETNTASLQANIDDYFYKADATIATKHQDNSYTIIGTSNDQKFTLHITNPQANEYPVGGGSDNWASYEDENGNVYSTIPDGEGAITVTSWDTSFKTLTGNFNLTLILPGIDTLTVSQGLFYEVPYGFGVDPSIPVNAGTVIGKIDGVSFSPVIVSATDTGNNIAIVAAGATYTITLTLPNDILEGTYSIPSNGITATLSDGNFSETATSGVTVVVENDTSFKLIKGTFSFTTENHEVTFGQFNVGY